MPPIPVIIDTDPGVDDVLAILLALASPELQVLAIIVSYGNTDINASYINILRLYQVLSKHLSQHPEDKQHWPNVQQERKTILASGAIGPLEGEVHSAQYFHGRDGLGGITDRYPEFNPNPSYKPNDAHPQLILTSTPGVEVALDIIRSEPSQSVTYIALGPMTTLARVVREDGEVFKERIGRVVCMGGALDVPGNTSPVAEFNFFADPYAVHDLLVTPSSNLPLSRFILIPLDITTPHQLPFPYYVSQIDPTFSSPNMGQVTGKKPLVHFTSAFLERTREVMLEFGNDAMELHDITAVWCAIANPPLPNSSRKIKGWTFVKRKFQIERKGEITRGMLVVDRRDDKGAYAPGSNRSQVQAELERHPEFHPRGVLESTAVPAQVEVEDSSQAHPPHVTVLGGVVGGSDEGEEGEGIIVVAETPGPDALLELLARRVWGVGR